MFTFQALRQNKTVEETSDRLLGAFVEHLKDMAVLENPLLLVVPFGTEKAAQRGCLFVVLDSPLNKDEEVERVATSLSLMLHRAALNSPVTLSTPVRPTSDVKIRQAVDHDMLWSALNGAIKKDAGTRLEYMASTFPQAFGLFDQYAPLKGLMPQIEEARKLTLLVETAWKLMAGTDRRSLYYCRKRAGLPRRRTGLFR